MSDDLQNATSEALRKLGRDDLADQLEQPAAPDPEPEVDEGEAFVQELKAALGGNKVSLPGLLDA